MAPGELEKEIAVLALEYKATEQTYRDAMRIGKGHAKRLRGLLWREKASPGMVVAAGGKGEFFAISLGTEETELGAFSLRRLLPDWNGSESATATAWLTSLDTLTGLVAKAKELELAAAALAIKRMCDLAGIDYP